MTRYAQRTEVSTDKSRAEIERTLSRYGATAFVYGWQGNAASIMFEAHGRRIRYNVPMPSREQFRRSPTGKPRAASAIDREWEQAQRQRWRALSLLVKAKLEAIECGIATFEDAFLAETMIPGSGQTVSEWAQDQLAIGYESGDLPPLLPGPRH